MTDDIEHRPSPDGDDPTAARLRRALTTEAAMVQTAGDGLQRIRDGIGVRSRWWRHPAVALVAAAVTGLAVAAAYVGLRGDDGGSTVASPSQTPTQSAAPSGSASPSGSPSPSSTPSGNRATAYVYYIHDDAAGPRLYREQHLAVGDGPLAAGSLGAGAVRAMFGKPDDPDYATPWDGTTLLGYAKDGDTATVDLSSFVAVGAGLEEVAVQELVYTVTANDTSVKRVRLLVDGKAPSSGHQDWSQPISRAPMVDVQGLIWLLSPTQDATVTSPVTIEGYGTAFEGTVSWEVRRDGEVVEQGVTAGGSNGEFDTFTDTVALPPGEYEIRAFESSAKDGSPIHIDTKNVTVR